MLLCRLETEYGDRVYNIFEPVRLGDTHRDVARESAAMQAVRRFFPKIYRKERYFALDTDEEFFEFLEEGNAVLSQVGEVWMSEDLRKLKISRPPRVSAGISIKSDLLSLQITSDELPYEELGRLLESYRLKKRFFRLENGQFIRLEDNSLSTHIRASGWSAPDRKGSESGRDFAATVSGGVSGRGSARKRRGCSDDPGSGIPSAGAADQIGRGWRVRDSAGNAGNAAGLPKSRVPMDAYAGFYGIREGSWRMIWDLEKLCR